MYINKCLPLGIILFMQYQNGYNYVLQEYVKSTNKKETIERLFNEIDIGSCFDFSNFEKGMKQALKELQNE